jgi:protein involved in polysaccharide export with SLBB domain
MVLMRVPVLFALLLGLAAAAPAYATTAVRPDAPASTVAADSIDALRPGDVLRLRIWREPDLSGDFVVNERGEATLPKLGPVAVGGIPTDSLRSLLVGRYQAFLNNPSVEVTPLRRVSVLGAVKQPGLYPVDATMKVADVLALAGGPAPDGRQDRLELRRDGERVVARLDASALVADSPLRSGDQIYVPQKGWLSRNTWLVSTTVGAGLTLLTLVLR